jgi:hypothetical protein
MTPELMDRVIDLALIVGLVAMGLAFGLGRVSQETSYGLTDVIGVLGVIAGGRFMGRRQSAKEADGLRPTSQG